VIGVPTDTSPDSRAPVARHENFRFRGLGVDGLGFRFQGLRPRVGRTLSWSQKSHKPGHFWIFLKRVITTHHCRGPRHRLHPLKEVRAFGEEVTEQLLVAIYDLAVPQQDPPGVAESNEPQNLSKETGFGFRASSASASLGSGFRV